MATALGTMVGTVDWTKLEEVAQDISEFIDEEQGFETLIGKEFIWVETQKKYTVFADDYDRIILQDEVGKFHSLTYRTFLLNIKEKEFVSFDFMNELDNL